MSEPSVEEIVARCEIYEYSLPRDEQRALIASWRERGEENRRLREALRGFVDKQPGGNYRDDVTHTIWVNAGQFRRAAAALKDKP